MKTIRQKLALAMGLLVLWTSLVPGVSLAQEDLGVNALGAMTRQRAEENYDHVERFPVKPDTGQYADEIYQGQNGINWTLKGARWVNQYSFNGQGVILGNKNEDNSEVAASLPQGLGKISIDLKKAYKGKSKRQMGLYINEEESPRLTIDVPNTNFKLVQLQGEINEPGPVKISIKPINPTGSRAQVTVGNIAWTDYSQDQEDPKDQPGQDQPGEDPKEEPGKEGVLTIKDAKGKNNGQEVTVQGIVTYQDDNNVIFQDQTGGLDYYPNPGNLDLGDRIQVKGQLGTFRGLRQVKDGEISVLEKGQALPQAKEVTLEDLLANAENYQGMRVHLRDLTLGQVEPSNWNLPLKQGNHTITLFDMNRTKTSGLKPGSKLNITAVLGKHDKDQLLLARAEDLEVVDQGKPSPASGKSDLIGQDLFEKYQALTIPQALQAPMDETITVLGIVTYAYGGGNNLIIQDKLGGEIVGYQIFGPPIDVKPGDIVVATGKATSFYGLPEIKNVEKMIIVGHDNSLKDPQEITAKEFAENGGKYVNEYIRIKDLTLPTYDGGKGQIYFTGQDGTRVQSYRAPAYPLGSQAGDTVDIQGAGNKHYDNHQISIADTSDYMVKNDRLAPHLVVGDLLAARPGKDYQFEVNILDNSPIKEANFSLNGKTYPLVKDEVKGVYRGTIPANLIKGDQLELSFNLEDVNGNKSTGYYKEPFDYGKSQIVTTPLIIKIDNRPYIDQVQPRAGYQSGADKRPKIEGRLVAAGENPSLSLKVNGQEVAKDQIILTKDHFSYTPKEDMADGKTQVEVQVRRTEDGAMSDPLAWTFYVGEAKFKHYYGQIHAHTNYSDGAGTPKEALDYAKAADQIDFFALTDHSNYFDESGNLGRLEDERTGLKSTEDPSKSKWQVYKDYFKQAQSKDFLPIYGYEMTWTKTGANYGHINTYNTEGFVSRNDPVYNDKQNSKGLLAYYDRLTKLDNSFSQFNHPGAVFGNFDEFGHYSKAYDDQLQLVEVGNGEGKIGSKGYFRSYDQYNLALDKGWHLSPSNNQDNHKKGWGDANDARNVAIAEDLTYPSILEAIRNHRFYATEDKNLRIDYTLDGQMMGSIYDGAGKELTAQIDLADQDPQDQISKVEMISNGGRVLKTETTSANTLSLTWTLPNQGSYYYVKVTQADGDIAVTSPIWTKQVDTTGINSLTKDKEVLYTGETFKLTTSFTNARGDTIKPSKVDYILKKDGQEVVLKSETRDLPQLKTGNTQFSQDLSIDQPGQASLLVRIYDSTGQVLDEKSLDLLLYPKDIGLSPIKEVQEAPENKPFKIRGRLTSNASGYDKSTAFFDSAYVQDESGGINIFPIAGNYQEGDLVEILGTTSSYQGEHQLNIDKIVKLDEPRKKVQPKSLKTGEVKNNLGLLVKTQGKVLEVKEDQGLIESLVLDDGSGPIRVFIDGYIAYPGSADKTMEDFKVGDTVEAIGLSSIDPLGNRIRVRNRADVKKVQGPKKPEDKPDTKKNEEKELEPGKISPRPSGFWFIGPSTQEKEDKISLPQKPREEVKPSQGFIDVGSQDWFAEAVAYVNDHKLMKGVGDRRFAPNTGVNRAMIVTTLYRLAGSPDLGQGNFKDVPEDSYYTEAVNWASQKGIVLGVDEDHFAPDRVASREEVVTMLIRYLELEKNRKLEPGQLDHFKDQEKISPWAKEALEKAVKLGLIQGDDKLQVKPKEKLTRAELAQLLMNLDRK